MSQPPGPTSFVVLPVLHSAVAGVSLVLMLILLGWSLVAEARAAATMSAALAVASLAGLIDATTARMWIAADRLWVRRWAFWLRSFPISEIIAVAFDPGEVFEVQFEGGRRIGFPARGENLASLASDLETRLPESSVGSV